MYKFFFGVIKICVFIFMYHSLFSHVFLITIHFLDLLLKLILYEKYLSFSPPELKRGLSVRDQSSHHNWCIFVPICHLLCHLSILLKKIIKSHFLCFILMFFYIFYILNCSYIKNSMQIKFYKLKTIICISNKNIYDGGKQRASLANRNISFNITMKYLRKIKMQNQCAWMSHGN